MKLMDAGTLLDGFVVGACIHSGGMAHIYQVTFERDGPHPDQAGAAPTPGGTAFPMVMKVPRMTPGDGAENIVSFEVEQQIMPALSGPHVPRYVAAGDLNRVPYIVMEQIEGQTFQDWIGVRGAGRVLAGELAEVGAAIARALHSLHQQNACHLDLKPANVVIRPEGLAVLLDFGLSCHAHYPDLHAEELRKAVGSPAWIAPEQVVGVRGDPRSDIFALGVMLYEATTGELPFGSPQTDGGMRQRLWMDPVPVRQRRPDVPEWLQEVIMRCLAALAQNRYPSAAHVAFDLSHPAHIAITERGRQQKGTSWWTHLKRWVHAAGMAYVPSPPPVRQIEKVPIVMVAVPHRDVADATLYALREAVARSLGVQAGAQLACVTVLSPNDTDATSPQTSETTVHRRHLAMLRQWAQPLDLTGRQASFHVLEASDVADALISYAQGNHVSVIVMGAATHGLQLQRLMATVPIKVAMYAPCSVILVKQQLPFHELLQTSQH